MGNAASAKLVEGLVDPSILDDHMNYLRLVFHPLGARRHIVNWEEVARHLLGRAERELGRDPHDQPAVSLLAELREYAGPSLREPRAGAMSAADLLLPVHIRKDGVDLRMFSTIMTLGTPQDVTLQELRIETFFPADPESEQIWRRVMAKP